MLALMILFFGFARYQLVAAAALMYQPMQEAQSTVGLPEATGAASVQITSFFEI